MLERYDRNYPTISPREQAILAARHVAVIGCGGLGGNILERLLRLGVGTITLADGDVFELSNLNRQILCSEESIGESKVLRAVKRAASVNPDVRVIAHNGRFCAETAALILSGCDVAVDALDNIASRLLLEDCCGAYGIPLVHGAVEGWRFQVAVSLPGSELLNKLYAHSNEQTRKSCLAFTPAICAAVQTAEAVKLLLGYPSQLSENMLMGRLDTMTFERVGWSAAAEHPPKTAY